jgi:hypothetical protein
MSHPPTGSLPSPRVPLVRYSAALHVLALTTEPVEGLAPVMPKAGQALCRTLCEQPP